MRREASDPEPVDEVHVFCCTNERPATRRRGCCASKGSESLANYMCRRGIVRGGGRHSRINLSGCLNLCEYGPVLVVYPEGVWYRYETEADIDKIVDQLVLRGERVPRLLVTPDPSRMHR